MSSPLLPVATHGDFIVESQDWLRAELDKLGEQVDRIAAGEADGLAAGKPSLGIQMRSHCTEFCAALTQHHTGEDMGAFPMLAQRFPGLAPTVAKLVDEHRTVDRFRGHCAERPGAGSGDRLTGGLVAGRGPVGRGDHARLPTTRGCAGLP